MLLADPFDRLDELDVDLNRVAGLLLLVALPALGVAFVALRGRKTIQVGSAEDAPDAGGADGDVVVPLQVHGDLRRNRSAVRITGTEFPSGATEG